MCTATKSSNGFERRGAGGVQLENICHLVTGDICVWFTPNLNVD